MRRNDIRGAFVLNAPLSFHQVSDFTVQKHIHICRYGSLQNFIGQFAHHCFLKDIQFSCVTAIQIVRIVKIKIDNSVRQDFILSVLNSRMYCMMNKFMDDGLFPEGPQTEYKIIILDEAI